MVAAELNYVEVLKSGCTTRALKIVELFVAFITGFQTNPYRIKL